IKTSKKKTQGSAAPRNQTDCRPNNNRHSPLNHRESKSIRRADSDQPTSTFCCSAKSFRPKSTKAKEQQIKSAERGRSEYGEEELNELELQSQTLKGQWESQRGRQ
uniref:Uncharacterized protein n=1 Tax=Bursaphelenchus xylophilus TaxID=6326 RepID=A0A1I7SIL5_BURXY